MIHDRHNSPWPQNQVAVSADSAQTTRKIFRTLWAEYVQESGEFALSLSCPGNQSLAPQLPFIPVPTKLAQGWQDPSLVCAVCSIHQGLCSPGTAWEARGGSSASILPSSRLGAPPSGFCLFQRKNPWDNSQMVPSDSPGAFHRHMVAYLGPESRVGRN